MAKGVNWHKTRKRWLARIYRNGKMYQVGYFHTEEEAIAAHSEAEKHLNVRIPKISLAERRAEREHEKVLQEIDAEHKKRGLLPDFD